MYWLVRAKRHDNDFDVSLFLLAIVQFETRNFGHHCQYMYRQKM
jgi:hypothetical protein